MNDNSSALVSSLVLGTAKAVGCLFKPDFMTSWFGVPGMTAKMGCFSALVPEAKAIFATSASIAKELIYEVYNNASYVNSTNANKPNSGYENVAGVYSNNPYKNVSKCDEKPVLSLEDYLKTPSNSTPIFLTSKMTNDTFSKEYGQSILPSDQKIEAIPVEILEGDSMPLFNATTTTEVPFDRMSLAITLPASQNATKTDTSFLDEISAAHLHTYNMSFNTIIYP
jgi:hypothetical protein